MEKKTRRQKLADAIGEGILRYELERTRLQSDVQELLIEIASQYCKPRRKRRKVN